MNCVFTFRTAGNKGWEREWRNYLLVNLGGGGVNLSVYLMFVWMFDVEALPWMAVVGVGFGSVAGWVVNYKASKLFVFTGSKVSR